MINYFYKDDLRSKRLRTRYLTMSDVAEWTKFFEDKDCTEFLPNLGLSSPQERANFWIDKQMKRYADKRFGLQALIDKETNEFVGQCGLLLQDVDGMPEVEVGYHMFKDHWGKGYAPEAAKLFLDFAFKNKVSDNVISIIDINNKKSQRVAEKNGLKKEKQTKWTDLDVFIYRIKKAKSE